MLVASYADGIWACHAIIPPSVMEDCYRHTRVKWHLHGASGFCSWTSEFYPLLA